MKVGGFTHPRSGPGRRGAAPDSGQGTGVVRTKRGRGRADGGGLGDRAAEVRRGGSRAPGAEVGGGGDRPRQTPLPPPALSAVPGRGW